MVIDSDPARADRPLSPRSLALSVLLGTHPPSLPIRAFMRLADEFSIARGTMRTALSRLVTAGDLVLDDGHYRLGSSFEARQRGQDLARTEHDGAWDGSWHTIIAADDQRELAERRRFRSTMTDAHFGMLRPDIWMRPANLPVAPPADRSWLCSTGPLSGPAANELVSRLWPIQELTTEAIRLITVLRQVRRSGVPTRTMFTTTAAALRHLRRDPLLPPELTPRGRHIGAHGGPHSWPLNDLRHEFTRTETELQARLRQLFAQEVGPRAMRSIHD